MSASEEFQQLALRFTEPIGRLHMRRPGSYHAAHARPSVTLCFLAIFVVASLLFPGTVTSRAAGAHGGTPASAAVTATSLWHPINPLTTPRDYLAAAATTGAIFAFGGY